ncbi:stabilizer of axonemal microtubules 1 [Python bivittatus]|uniref:Stabilizer of axonemal microtubules 1 n=1 Tax=Python bivittatus TaxID=176946 RepID=A0A9F2PM02_PYTBI|nr:stabilizer of axonemal microtubules 1 [Python bivittatus]
MIELRHHCPHLPTRPFEMNEKPCLLSEYTEKYPLYPNVLPRESCKPKAEYNKQPVPMEGLSTTKRDYIPHEVFRIKQKPPDKYVKKDECMDLQSTYRQDYNPYSVSRVPPCLPQEQNYSSAEKMTSIPTYKSDYVAWNQPKREMIKPDTSYHPSEKKFDHRTTNQDEYQYKGLVTTKNYKPLRPPHISKFPLESMTNYKLNYVAHPIPKRFVHTQKPFKGCDVPFDGLTTHKFSYKGLAGQPAKSMKPDYTRPDLGNFEGTTEFKEKYQAWPVSAPFSRKPAVYTPPKEKMDLQTSVQIHYGNPNGRPATSCKPLARVTEYTEPFDHCSTTKDDFKHWRSERPKPILPHPAITLPTEPMDLTTSFQTHYIPHPLPSTKSFRPHLPVARHHEPFADTTTYATSYTAKEVRICPASFKEPPGYRFDKIDEGGHRRFRPATGMQPRRSSSSTLADYRGRPGSRLSQAVLQDVALKA